MAALEAALQLASGQRQPKQAKNEKGKGKGPDGGSSEDANNSSLLKETLRLTLQSQQMIRSAFDATTIAILYSHEDDKHELSNLMNQWFEQLPKRSEQQIKDRIFPEHPMKLSRKVLGVQYAVKIMAKAKPTEDSVMNEPWSVLQALADLPPEEMDLQIQDCKPKFRQPKDGRKWLWHLSLSPVATSEMRTYLATLLGKNFQFKSAGVEFLPALTTQSQLEKDLWRKLRV